MPLRFEDPSIHGLHHVTAYALTEGRWNATLALTLLNAAGETVDTNWTFDNGARAYVLDLMEAINAVAVKHGRLSADEHVVLFADEEIAA